MAKFKYRMQNILDIKQKLEEAAKMEFAEANLRVMKEEEKLSEILHRKRKYEAHGCIKRELRAIDNAISITGIRQSTVQIEQNCFLHKQLLIREVRRKSASHRNQPAAHRWRRAGRRGHGFPGSFHR